MSFARIIPRIVLPVILLATTVHAEKVLFQDDFKGKLGKGWSWVREHREAWRVSDRALEVRLEPGNLWGKANDAKNILVRPAPDVAPEGIEITVTVENRPTSQYEQVDLAWYYDDGHMVKLGQELVNGKLSIVMGREEKDLTRTIKILPLAATKVQLRFVVKGDSIRGQFCEEGSDQWHTVGECDLPVPPEGKAKISLQFYQGPADAEHWARVSEFRVRQLPQAKAVLKLQNRHLRLEIGPDARCLQFTSRANGTNYSVQPAANPFASVKKSGRAFPATSAGFSDGKLTVNFGEANVTATLNVASKKTYFILEVAEVRGDGVEELVFADFPLTVKASPGEPFTGCALALNVQTRVDDIPGATRRLWAACYLRFGLVGAKVALIGCPSTELRKVLQEAVSASPDLPHSAIGGPWAWDADINRGSYLFNFGDMSETKVDGWIKLARDLGFTQIDFHGGTSFRFGDCVPNPKTYTNGWASFKAVIDKLHAAGLQAGLHTYAQFIDKRSKWVTPVPDPRLAKDATFTLAQPLTTSATNVPVTESTKNMSTVTGFFVHNSVTLQIDDELIIYTGFAKEPPYEFTGCKRGAHGTRVAEHAAGAKVHHLKECFGLFLPDGDSTLYTEVAAATAEAFNTGGFDMMYLDALDGSSIFGGPENAWYYQSKFVFEIWKRLKKPALMEMSTFSHHLWLVRSRMGAWDHPNRSHKRFIDMHCAGNEDLKRMFLPGHLGWWRIKTWGDMQDEPTYADDIEYLCGKAIGTDCGFSVMGVDPGQTEKVAVFKRLAGIMRQYEELRHADYFDAPTKAALAELGKEFTLVQDTEGRWRFRPVVYHRQKIDNLKDQNPSWQVTNPFAAQPVRLRIEALNSISPYDTPKSVTVADYANTNEFSDRKAAAGVTMELRPGTEHVKADLASAMLTATNSGQVNRTAAWAKVGKTFHPPLNLTDRQGLGLWVHGDGKGEILNVQLTSPEHISGGIGDHYIPVDFTGWRYFELVEPEGERWQKYTWPYGGLYSIYREHVDFRQVETVSFWFNNLPPGQRVTCHVSPIRGLSVFSNNIKNPAVTIGGRTLVFPVELESGGYLEFNSLTDCKHYKKDGSLIGDVKPQGDVPMLTAGGNRVEFRCDAPADVNSRAHVTVSAQGELMGGVNPKHKLKAAK